MALAENTDLIDAFDEFYRNYYRDEIGELAQGYPTDQKSLYVDWQDLYRFDPDLADDLRTQPDQYLEYAEEALRLYDLPVDVSLDQAHVRIRNLPDATPIRDIRADHRGQLIAVQGIVRKATDVRPKVTNAAFECQRCGTLTRIPQTAGDFQEPHECQGCERQGPFRVNFDQSEFVDAQKIRVQESPEGLRGGETPQNIDLNIEDDACGTVTAGDHVTAIGILELDQQGNDREKSPMFDVYMNGVSVEIEDEQFEEMDITDEDKREIVELSQETDIYEQMVGSIAPSIYGFDEEKLAMTLQLFSGVTKHLPDGSRIRGDLHMLLIGDPGTGKSQLLSYIQNIAPRSVYTSGKGSSSAGLTAAAVRDDFGEGQQWSLEAGALVLADQGIAAVDELDKMKCVTGDTLVHLGDRIARIRDLAHDAARDGDVEPLDNGRTIRDVDVDAWTMTDAGRLETRPVTAIHEYEAPESLVEVRLASGERVTATADHPYFVFEDGERVEKPAAEVEPDDWVYVPRAIQAPAADGGAVAAGDGDAGCSPARIDDGGVGPSMAAVLGYLAGDGNLYYNSDEGVYGVRFTNAEEQLLAHFEHTCERAFDAEPVRPPSEQRADGVETVRLPGKAHADAVIEAGMNLETYDGKRLPEAVTRSSRAAKAAFVRALADSEGNVDGRKVKVSSASEELLVGVKHLLLEFGVSCQIHRREREQRRDIHHLVITDAESLATYERTVGFTLDRKRERLAETVETVSGDRTILDVIPEASGVLADLRASLRLYQSECGLDDATYCDFESGKANISLRLARVVLDAFEDRKRAATATLEELADGDWDELERVRTTFHVSQRELAETTSYGQQQISARWGEDDELRDIVAERLRSILRSVATTDLSPLDRLVHGDVKWRRVESVETVAAEADDDRVRLLREELAELIDCPAGEAVDRARTLVTDEPDPQDWDSLRSLADRYSISMTAIAADLGVDQSTVSRWFNEVVETNRFGEVRRAVCERSDDVRAELRRMLEEIDARQRPHVYDLTVAGTHNFVANGMVVHNSEDRSAMHEALEQQSYHPETEVLLANGNQTEIGDLVDERMAGSPDSVVDGVDCEILPVDDLRIHTTDLESNETTKTDVDRVSRHEAPDEFVRVEFSNGRSVVVTPEHPMFADRDGDVGTVPAAELAPGAFVPAPRKLPNSAAGVSLDAEPTIGKEHDVDLPAELTPDLAEALGLLVAEGHSYAGSAHEIGFSNQDERLLERMQDLMQSVFGFASTDTTNEAGTVTQRWVSTKLYRWFEANFPELMETARDKRIPAAVLGASEESIRRFLVGAFAGDGGVESEAMAFSTASSGLAEDYADALAKIGVASRIHHDSCEDSWKVYVMGDSTERFVDRVVDCGDGRYEDAQAFVERSNDVTRHHDVLPTSAAREIRSLRRLVGLPLTGQFKPNVDEGYGVRRETVSEQVAILRDRIADLPDELEGCDSLADLRSTIGWSGRQLADAVDGLTTSTVHYAESGGYDASKRRRIASDGRAAIESALSEASRRLDALEARLDLRYYRVRDVETIPNEGEYACDWVYDVTVEPTNTFVGKGVVLHNSISISKAGINATLKSRCSLLGAANPKYGRFDEFEPIGEQIDLEPALISRFDLIFTVTDQPDEERDADLAEHILTTNYAGEVSTHREHNAASDFTEEDVAEATETVDPTIDPDLLRKYIAHAKRSCFPTMSDAAREAIRDFYVDLRARGEDQDAAVPVTARKLEALVRLAEASARVRLSDTVEAKDAERVIDIVRSSLEDVGVDPETGEFDADVVETGTSKTQRDRIQNIKGIIADIESEYDEGAPVDVVVERAEEVGIEESKAHHEIDKLKQKGELYEPTTDHLRTT